MGGSLSCASSSSALMEAIAAGEAEAVLQILQRMPEVATYRTRRSRNSPMLAAAGRGHATILKYLHIAGLATLGRDRTKARCLDHTNIRGYTPLMTASRNGHGDCVRYLIASGSDPTPKDISRGCTCLHLAAANSHRDCIAKLLSFRQVADIVVPEDGTWRRFVDCHNSAGLSALHIAVINGDIDCVRTLLKWGASFEAKTGEPCDKKQSRIPAGSSVFHLAAMNADVMMVKLLLDYQDIYFSGGDLRSFTNASGKLPIEYVPRSGRFARLMLDPTVPFSTISSFWESREELQDKEQWKREAAVALQRVQLLLKACVFVMKKNAKANKVNPICEKEVSKLVKSITVICAALPKSLSPQKEEGNVPQDEMGSIFEGISSRIALESIVKISGNVARQVLRMANGGEGKMTDDFEVLEELVDKLQVKFGKDGKKPNFGTRACRFARRSCGTRLRVRQNFCREARRACNSAQTLCCSTQERLRSMRCCMSRQQAKDSDVSICHPRKKARVEQAEEPRRQRPEEPICCICMDSPEEVGFAGCQHKICLNCAVEICAQYTARGSTFVTCPFCRQLVMGFAPVRSDPPRETTPLVQTGQA